VPPVRSKRTAQELLTIVREVSSHVDPGDPTGVTQRAWDVGRAVAGHPDAPRAHAITERLGVPWRKLLQIAHGDRNDALRALGNAAADKGRKGLTLDRAATALRQAAMRLGKPGIDRSDYRRGRQQILTATRRGPARKTALRALPDLTQIETVLGQHDMTWDDLLAFAGLELAKRPENSGLDELSALRVFVEHVGRLPDSATQMRNWARASGVSVKKPAPAAFKAAVAQVTAERAAAGEPPLTRAARGERIDPAPAAANGTRARKMDWDRPQIIAGLAKTIRILDGKQLTQRALKEIARDHPDIPSYSQVDRCRRRHYPDETWDAWIAEATALARSPENLSSNR
jgi:hypothetical protein